MAEITGVYAPNVLAIEAGSIVSAEIDEDTKHLVFTKKNGDLLDVGLVVPEIPPPPTIPPAYTAWPVNSIFVNTTNTNPATLLGGGTWIRWAKGRVAVSVDENQPEFANPEATGGEINHQLTLAEMPNHSHGGSTGGRSADHTHGQVTLAGGQQGTGQRLNFTGDAINAIAYPMGANTNGESNDHSHGIAADGGNQPHNNLQPYITAYLWKRTA